MHSYCKSSVLIDDQDSDWNDRFIREEEMVTELVDQLSRVYGNNHLLFGAPCRIACPMMYIAGFPPTGRKFKASGDV